MENTHPQTVKFQLVETGGRISQEFGMGRIVGQVLVFLFLTEGDCSLDKIGRDLELSKASVSIAARQLEKLGLLNRSWKKGDRKNYYRTADNIETALRTGLISFIRQKVQTAGFELNKAEALLEKETGGTDATPDSAFVFRRVKRAKNLHDAVIRVIENPLLKRFVSH